MKKTSHVFKRTIACLMVVLMALTSVPLAGIDGLITMKASAATNHSQSEAVEWIKARGNENWWQDVDNAYGCQCVDLIMAYYRYLIGYNVWGNAKDYLSTSKLPSGWYMDTTPSPGAIIVWGGNTWTGQWTTGSNGHVGLVYSVSGSNVYTVETNTGGTGGYGTAAAAKFRTRVNCNAKFIHPDFSGAGGTTTNLGDDFYAYIIKSNTWKHLGISNENVCIAPEGNDSISPKQIWHFVRQSDNSYIIINEYNGKCLDAWGAGTTDETNVALFGNHGGANQRWFLYGPSYSCNIKASYCDLYLDSYYNGSDPGNNIQLFQKNNSEAQNFVIYHLTKDGLNYSKPASPNKVSVNVSVSSNTINISWSESPEKGIFDSREYDVRINEASTGKNVYTKLKLKGAKHTVTLNLKPGKYYVTVTAVNSKYYEHFTSSDKCTFCLHSKTERITKQPTCNSTGKKTITCSFCNYSEVKTIPATGSHTYTSSITTAATCTANGVKTYTCSGCGNSYTETIAKTGHKYDSGKITKTPTCVKTGVKTYTCTVCGAKNKETIAKDPNNHNAGSHSFNYEPPCTKNGYSGDWYCDDCDGLVQKGKVVKKTGHKDKNQDDYCDNCGKYLGEYPEDIKGVKVTAQTDKTISVTWKKISGSGTVYRLFLRKNGDKYFEHVGSTKSNKYTFKKLKPGTKYEWFVVVWNPDGSDKAISDDVKAATLPSAPSIKVTAGKKKADVKWGKVTGATNYTVYYSTSKKSGYKKAGTTSGKSYTVKKLKPGKTYYFKVVANKKVGSKTYTSAYSKIVSAKIKK